MKTALLIIDVQKAAKPSAALVRGVEEAQYRYDAVFVSKFVNKGSPLLPLTGWGGYDDEDFAFSPRPGAVVFEKGTYTSFTEALKDFDEVHLCGCDTDACVYKTALDLIENGVRPVVLSGLCSSEKEEYHQAGLTLLRRNIGAANVK